LFGTTFNSITLCYFVLVEWLGGQSNKACAAAKVWGADCCWEARTAQEVQDRRETGKVFNDTFSLSNQQTLCNNYSFWLQLSMNMRINEMLVYENWGKWWLNFGGLDWRLFMNINNN
jgi:hypothetical protein